MKQISRFNLMLMNLRIETPALVEQRINIDIVYSDLTNTAANPTALTACEVEKKQIVAKDHGLGKSLWC